jgi:hypothetical protein
MSKKRIKRLQLSKETLRSLSERDLQAAVGGASVAIESCKSDCWCITDDDSCPGSFRC